MKLTKNPIIRGGDQNLKNTAQTIENSAVKGGAQHAT